MKIVSEYAYAKINISLDVLSKRDDGYHEMCMVMESLKLCDDVNITVSEGRGIISVKTDKDYLPNDNRNIAWKAADVFLKEQNITGYDVKIDIIKRVPVCAGMGGGSSDGAAVLRGLNTAFETKLSVAALRKMGEKLGSDVPYCIAGGTDLATGRGEILESLKTMPRCHVVVCKPEFSVSTPELFKKIDRVKLKLHPDTNGIITALEEGDLTGVCRRMYNFFEDAGMNGYSEIQFVKGKLYDNGALGAVMSGTGSAVYGIFDCPEKAQSAYSSLKDAYKDCFLTELSERIEI